MKIKFRRVSPTSSQIFWFVGQCIVLLACVAFIEFIYYNNIYPDKHVKESFTQTTCTVQQKQLSIKGHIFETYRADYLLNYIVNANSYAAWATANGLDRGFSSDRATQEALLEQYDVGGAYPCWYDPDSPSIVVLVLRHNWSSTFPLIVPSVVALIMLFYLSITVFKFFGLVSIRTRETIRKKRQVRKKDVE